MAILVSNLAITQPHFLLLPIRSLLLFLLSINCCNADDVLIAINKQLTKAPITQGKFQQEKRLKFLTKPLMSDGLFTYQQGKGVIWKTQTPVQTTMLITDSAMLTGEGKQAMPPAFGDIFKALLGGELQRLQQNFDITGTNQKSSWTLQLTPKDDMLKKVISHINITGDLEVRDWELQETGGNLTRIHFTDIAHPNRLSSTQQTDFEILSP